MWVYAILGATWLGILLGWMLPMIRQRIIYEIYAAFGIGGSLTLLILGAGGVLTKYNIVPLRVIGFILYIPSLCLAALTVSTLKRKGKPKFGWEHTTLMINSNIFRTIRHPLYLAGAIWAIALALAFQSVLSAAIGVVSVFCLWMASKKEDAFNIGKFGDDYRDYMGTVPMWNIFRGLRKR